MKLKELLKSVEYESPDLDIDDIEIEGIACDSRAIKRGYLFIAIDGTKLDGHKFANEAIDRGAIAVVVQKDVVLSDGFPKIYVKDSRVALAKIANEFYGRPSEKIKCIGITGTNGKTTISYLMDSILTTAGHRVGIVGT
ncbi:MAG: Mur ligase domain-containing protein, partial [Candidatus Omnitrophota bacterium]